MNLFIQTHSSDSLPAYVLFLGENDLKQKVKLVSTNIALFECGRIFKSGFTERQIRKILRQPTSGSVIVYKNNYFLLKNSNLLWTYNRLRHV
jgi:hypothetical protein